MPISTKQQIHKWFERYRSTIVNYSHEVTEALGINTKVTRICCKSFQWPCIVHSASFESARVLTLYPHQMAISMAAAENAVSLRMELKAKDADKASNFLIGAKVVDRIPMEVGSRLFHILALRYCQRPPDEIIESVGIILDAYINSVRRRDERIVLEASSIRRLKLGSAQASVRIQGMGKRCIVRDLSFSGAKIIMMGLARFLVGRTCDLVLNFEDSKENVVIPGTLIRSEAVEGRRDLAALAIHFVESKVPISYKIHIDGYLGRQRKSEATRKALESFSPSAWSQVSRLSLFGEYVARGYE